MATIDYENILNLDKENFFDSKTKFMYITKDEVAGLSIRFLNACIIVDINKFN